jgi:hypothetical protein
MEKSRQSLSLFEFQQQFATDKCLAYLAAGKWENGYVCPIMRAYTFIVQV